MICITNIFFHGTNEKKLFLDRITAIKPVNNLTLITLPAAGFKNS